MDDVLSFQEKALDDLVSLGEPSRVTIVEPDYLIGYLPVLLHFGIRETDNVRIVLILTKGLSNSLLHRVFKCIIIRCIEEGSNCSIPFVIKLTVWSGAKSDTSLKRDGRETAHKRRGSHIVCLVGNEHRSRRRKGR